MITSIFSKSKPINFIIVFFITLLAFISARTKLIIEPITVGYVLKQLVIFLLCGSTILVFSFIISKNNLTKKNNYDILLFSLFLLVFVQTTSNTSILLSNFFVLLGLRRLMSLRSQKSIKNKYFDAAFWIAIAAVFYFWAILFFALILISLILYTDNYLRHWLIPFAGVLTVFLIAISVSIVFYGGYFDVFKALPVVNYDFSVYNTLQYLVGITLLLSFGIWSSIFYLQNIKKKKKAFRASFKIIIFAAIIAFIIILLSPVKSGSEFLFAFAPLAIIITNYIEIIEDKWFKEVFVSVLAIVPFVLLLL
jgi:hypothetical protein